MENDSFKYVISKPLFVNLSKKKGEQDYSAMVISLQTRKTLDANAGTWEIRFAPTPNLQMETSQGTITKDNWESFIYMNVRPMDVCSIGMNGSAIMLGIVDNVYKSKEQNNGGVSRTIVVRGRDATKLFLEDSVANAPELITNTSVVDLLGTAVTEFMGWVRGFLKDGNHIFIDSEIPQAIWWILQNTPAMWLKIDEQGVSRLKSARELFLTNLVSRTEDRIFDDSMSIYSGKLINYMKQCLDGAFYEMWVDTYPAGEYPRADGTKIKFEAPRPCLFVRPKPFDNEYEIDSAENKLEFKNAGRTIDFSQVKEGAKWDEKAVPLKDISLPTWKELVCPIFNTVPKIMESEIISKNIGVSDYEVMSMYKVFASKDPIAASQAGRFGMYFPLVDGVMVLGYGLRELQADSRYIPPPNDWMLKGRKDLKPEDIKRYDGTKIGKDLSLTIKDVQSASKAKKDVFNKTKYTVFMVEDKRDRLWRMHRYNHLFESGTITIGGRDIRVGCKVELPEEQGRGIVNENGVRDTKTIGLEFYCTAVTHNYQFGGIYTASLALNRGHNPKTLKQYHDSRGFNEKANHGNSRVYTAEYGQDE